MPRLLLLGVAASCLAGCAGITSAPRTTGVSRPVVAQVESLIEARDGLAWHPSRALRWEDFQAQPPVSGNEGALTSYNLMYGTRCTRGTFTFEVAAVFLPRQSWVKPEVLSGPAFSAQTLRHEQTHFDLTEVYARELRQLLRASVNPCGTGADRVREDADRLVGRESDAQRQYDADTRNGLDTARQQAWNRDVGQWLVELEDLVDEGGVTTLDHGTPAPRRER